MLQPLQLQDVSIRFVGEIAELRDFLAKSGLALDMPESLGSVAARLRTNRAFHRDLTSYIWALSYGRREPISYANLLGLLAVAAAGPRFAASAGETDAHDLLRFVMEAQQSLHGGTGPRDAEMARPAAAGLTFHAEAASEPPALETISHKARQNAGPARRRSGWTALSVACVLVLFAGVWLYLRSGERAAPRQVAVAPIAPVATPATVQPRPGAPEASYPVTARDSAGSNYRKGSGRSAPLAAPKAPLAMAGAMPVHPAVAAEPSFPVNTGVAGASAGRAVSSGTAINGAIPSAVLSRRLGSPSLPAYASTQQDDEIATPRRPRLLRRSPHTSSTVTDGDAELIAEMKVPSGIAPGAGRSAGSATTPQGIVRPASLGIMAGNVVYSPAPAYPAAASAAHVQGEVKVQATIDRDGNVASARVISGPPLLRDAALDAVQRWRYRPYMAGGKPSSVTALAVMDFQLP